eukprot:IDg21978t1
MPHRTKVACENWLLEQTALFLIAPAPLPKQAASQLSKEHFESPSVSNNVRTRTDSRSSTTAKQPVPIRNQVSGSLTPPSSLEKEKQLKPHLPVTLENLRTK